jgi:SPX domain protein involved in polyphosphate accumulation
VSYRLDRFEMKFVITPEQRDRLMPHLLPFLKADENAGEGAFYPIVSLYYDNADRDCYWEKIRSFGNRRKLRVRVYGSLDGALPPTCFVEVKHKCDGRGVKRRVRMPLDVALSAAAGEPIDLPLSKPDRQTIEEVHKLVHQRGFLPCCCMRYDRQAFADKDPESDLRITFDTGIAYRMENLMPIPDDQRFTRYLLPDGYAVMEVKVTGSVPYWLTKMVGQHGCILQSHSKYCNALEDGDPVLHAQIGGRVEKHHYGITPSTLPAATMNDVVNPATGSSSIAAAV